MSNDYNMVDPQLRTAGRIFKLINRPSLRGLRVLHWTMIQSIGKDIDGIDSRTVWIKRSDGNGTIRTRIFRPKDSSPNNPLPIVIYLHGGGFAIGAPEQSFATYKKLLATRDCVIVAPDFRNSLTDPYPAGLHDCYDTLLWAKENAAEIDGRADQIFVAGESGGGGLTVAVTLLARDRGEVNIAFQMPLYPMIDDRQTNRSAVNNNMPVWNSKHNKVAWDLYLRGLDEADADIPPYAAPARATDYTGLPPAATFVGDLDPFYDETKAYVANLQAAGIPVQLRVFEGCYHGFDQAVPSADKSKEATQFMLDAFAYAVANYFAENVAARL